MLLRRIYEETISQASYVVACDETQRAIVVDPHRDIQVYIDLAKAEKLTIAYVTETHIHADFVSGAALLAKETGAKLLLSGLGGKAWQYAYAKPSGATILGDGDRIDVGTI